MSTFRNRLRKQHLVLAVAGVLGIACSAYAALPVSGGAHYATLTRATALSKGDVVRGAVPFSQYLHVTVGLKLRNEAQMKAFLANPHHGKMSPAELAANHLPTRAQAQAVADFMTRSGFKNVRIAPNRLIVTGDATAAAAQSAFRTTLVSVNTHDGRQAIANSANIQVPAALAGTMQSVLGLQTVHKAHTFAIRMQPSATGGISGHNPLDFASIYSASSLAPASSVNVGIISAGDMSPTLSDYAQFLSNNSLPSFTPAVVCVDPGPYDNGTPNHATPITNDPTCMGNYDQGTIEWDLDSQDITGITGGVGTLTFYSANSLYNTDLTDTISEVVTPSVGEPPAQVINVSLGECERFEDSGQGGDGSAQTDDALFMTAAAQGQTFSVSTGDSGSDECGDGGLNSASYPASSPWVVAAAGTTLNASTGSSAAWVRETEWVGSGGSPSSFEMAQPWQSGKTYGTYAGFRGPDVAFDANPNTGAQIVIYGSLGQVGGTSLAAPLFTGAWARILQGNPGLGFAAPNLYNLPATDLHDIISGNNGGYITKRGWDWASGLGSFKVDAAAASLGGGGG